MILKFAKSALEPARAGSYAHRHFGAGDAVWGRNAARCDRKNTKIADIEKARKVKNRNISLEVSSVLKMYKKHDFYTASKTEQHRKCAPRGGPVGVSARAALCKFEIVKIQLVLQSHLAGTKLTVHQVLGIIILSRACSGRKIHLKMQPSKMCPALKEK